MSNYVSSPAYKARKENFVSNLSGGTLQEINLVTLVAPAAVLLYTALQKRLSFFTSASPVSLATDFLLNVCAILFATTLYSSAPIVLNLLLIIPAVVLLLPLLPGPQSHHAPAKKAKTSPAVPATIPIRSFLTSYRGSMLVATTVAILAVDFPVFPRRFAKVETWGTSLMDIGVGSFVYSAGIVSARSVVKARLLPSARTPSLPKRLVSAVRNSGIMLAFGLTRLISVKMLNYAEHVSEYGVHWNFFMTLALLPPSVELADSITRHLTQSYDLLALLLAGTYELALNNTDLLKYIISAPRTTFVSQNREGILSFIGYLSIFLVGRATGIAVLTPTTPQANKPAPDPATFERNSQLKLLRSLLIRLAIPTLLFVALISYHTFSLRVSRRLANLPYVLWVIAFNNFQLLLFASIDYVGGLSEISGKPSATKPPLSSSKPPPTGSSPSFSPTSSRLDGSKVSTVLQSYNTNGFYVFLFANVMTGLVNKTMNTLDMSNQMAMGVLIAYCAVVTAVAVGGLATGLKLKL